MLKNTLVSLLIVLLAAPLDAGAAAWMAMSMDQPDQPAMTMQDGSVHRMAMAEAVDSAAAPLAHDHDEVDCEEHCLSCHNHCSSAAIVSSSQDSLVPAHLHTGFRSAAALNRIDLLFRPPISV